MGLKRFPIKYFLGGKEKFLTGTESVKDAAKSFRTVTNKQGRCLKRQKNK